MTTNPALITAIEESLSFLNLEYPTFQMDSEGVKLKLWVLMLRDFDPQVIEHAVYHLVSLGREFPPNVGQVREQCSLMSSGQLHEPTGQEAWERIWRKVAGEDVELTDLERKTLKQTASIYDLKRSTNQSTDRAHFIKAFDILVAKQKLERQTLPEVRALVEKNRPALPPKEEAPQLPGKEPEYHSPSEVSKLVAGVVGSKSI